MFKFHLISSCSVIQCDLLPVQLLPYASSPSTVIDNDCEACLECTAALTSCLHGLHNKTSAAQLLQILRQCLHSEWICSVAVLQCPPKHFEPNTQ